MLTNRRHRHRPLTIACFLMLFAGFTGCSSSDDDTTAPMSGADSSSEPESLTTADDQLADDSPLIAEAAPESDAEPTVPDETTGEANGPPQLLDAGADWATACVMDEGLPGDPIEFERTVVSFDPARVVVLYDRFSDADCSQALGGGGGLRYEGLYRLGKPFTTDTGLEALEFDVTYTAITDEKGKPKQQDDIGRTELNLVFRDGATLYFGADVDDRFSERPSRVDFDRPYFVFDD